MQQILNQSQIVEGLDPHPEKGSRQEFPLVVSELLICKVSIAQSYKRGIVNAFY